MTLPTWAERKGRTSLVPLSKLQLLGAVRTGGEERERVRKENKDEEGRREDKRTGQRKR